MDEHLTRQTRGWTRAWAVLARSFDIDAADDVTGETWQYMGTAWEVCRLRGRVGDHQFRHRSLNGARVYAEVRAEAGDFDVDPNAPVDDEVPL